MRNKFEEKVAKQLGPSYQYEPVKLSYTLTCNYIPDFVDEANKRIIEAKGLFTAEDRRKHVAFKQQHPDWHVTIVFQKPNMKITKSSKTTYGDWCDKHGIAWRSV